MGKQTNDHDNTQKTVKSDEKTRILRVEAMKAETHRAVLKFINEAVRSDELMHGKPLKVHRKNPHPENHPEHGGHGHKAFMRADAWFLAAARL
jgi:hypothetical protein